MCDAVTYILEVIGLHEANGKFALTNWDENVYTERAPGKLTRASVTMDFSGEITGAGTAEWLMCYRADGTADFVGLQEIRGVVDRMRGEFVVTSIGTYNGELAQGRWEVLAGSGAGKLVGISGRGEFSAPMGPEATFQLAYEIG